MEVQNGKWKLGMKLDTRVFVAPVMVSAVDLVIDSPGPHRMGVLNVIAIRHAVTGIKMGEVIHVLSKTVVACHVTYSNVIIGPANFISVKMANELSFDLPKW